MKVAILWQKGLQKENIEKKIIYKWLLQIAIVNDKSFEKIKGKANQHREKLD